MKFGWKILSVVAAANILAGATQFEKTTTAVNAGVPDQSGRVVLPASVNLFHTVGKEMLGIPAALISGGVFAGELVAEINASKPMTWEGGQELPSFGPQLPRSKVSPVVRKFSF